MQPIGRKRQFGSNGYCLKLPSLGQSCLTSSNNNALNYLTQMVFNCPCVKGSQCVKDANSFFMVPLGYSGTCQLTN